MTNADSLRVEIVGHVMLLVHANVPPDAEDWAQMLSFRNAHRNKIRGNLVVAPPRADINAAQRADVASFMKETRISVAVVTESALIRGVTQAVGFLGVQVRAFSPTDLSSAFNYLIIPASRHAEMREKISEFEAQLASRLRSQPTRKQA